MQGLSAYRQLTGEDRAAENGGDSPEKCGGRDKEVSAQGMRTASGRMRGIQESVTESDDGAGSRNWSRRTGSNPTMTSVVSPEKITNVGVSLLSYSSVIARRASRSALVSRPSYSISLSSRNIFISSQERQPGWVKSRTRVSCI